MGRLISNMLPRYSATVLALIMVACVMFDIGDGADTAGLEVVDVANAQHHDVATAQRHVAGAPDQQPKQRPLPSLAQQKERKQAQQKESAAQQKERKQARLRRSPRRLRGKRARCKKRQLLSS